MNTALQGVLARPFQTLPDFIAAHGADRPDHIALRVDAAELSYGALGSAMDKMAAALSDLGLVAGDRVAICAETSLSYCIVMLATLRAGMTVVPLAPSATPAQLAMMIHDSGAPVVFLDEAMQAALSDEKLSATVQALSEADLKALMARASEFTPPEIKPEVKFNIIYSSGTTGTPKGIVHSHAMRRPMMIIKDPPGYGPAAVTLLSTPLYSNTTMTSFLPTLAGGGTVILMKKFDVEGYLRLAEKWQVTHTMLVPVQYRRILAHENFSRYDLSSFEMKFCTSAPFAATLKAEVLERWPGGLIEYYGMTEGGGSCALVAHHHPDKLHTVGRPLPGHEIFAMRDDGSFCETDEVGEIVGRSGAIMEGYHNQPQKTRDAEWYDDAGRRYIRTGDVGRFDVDGFLTLMDRKKDMIISGGFNIYPSDIEAVLNSHPQIIESAIIGVPSEEWGETPVGYIVFHPQATVDSHQVGAWLNAQLGKTQRVRDIVAIDELPRSAIGKVLKRDLVVRYQTDRSI